MFLHNFALVTSACTQAFLFVAAMSFLKIFIDDKPSDGCPPYLPISLAIVLAILFFAQGYVSLVYVVM